MLVKARALYLHGQTRYMIAAVVRWSPQPMWFIFSVNILFHRSLVSPTCIPLLDQNGPPLNDINPPILLNNSLVK